jgi:hypothetical protein
MDIGHQPFGTLSKQENLVRTDAGTETQYWMLPLLPEFWDTCQPVSAEK